MNNSAYEQSYVSSSSIFEEAKDVKVEEKKVEKKVEHKKKDATVKKEETVEVYHETYY